MGEKDEGNLSDACKKCGSFCCTYYALPLETPETKEDYDDLRWFLMHEGNYICVEDGAWYLNIGSKCKNLLPEGKCAAYDKRPKICRKHGHKGEACEFFGEYEYEERFHTPEEIEWYAVREMGLKREEVKGWYVHEDEEFWKMMAGMKVTKK
jgi:Fe-S-cluster containining protein